MSCERVPPCAVERMTSCWRGRSAAPSPAFRKLRARPDAGADALQLDNAEKGPITASMIGKWVQISGRLERETSRYRHRRELDVATVRVVPVVVPRQAACPPAPAPAPAPAPRALHAKAPRRRLLKRHLLRHRQRRCRRRRARFQPLVWLGCSCCRQARLFLYVPSAPPGLRRTDTSGRGRDSWMLLRASSPRLTGVVEARRLRELGWCPLVGAAAARPF